MPEYKVCLFKIVGEVKLEGWKGWETVLDFKTDNRLEKCLGRLIQFLT